MIYLLFTWFNFCHARPGTVTAMSRFGEMMEKNIQQILFEADERSSKGLENLFIESHIYDRSFKFCDLDHDNTIVMEELLTCEVEFLGALDRKPTYQMTKMTIGDQNMDGKLHIEEWRAAGAIWDLGNYT